MRYRLLSRLPIEVVFQTRRFSLRLEFVTHGNFHVLSAYPDGSTTTHWHVETLSAVVERAERQVYEAGIDVPPATVPGTIFERLVREGRAEVLDYEKRL